MKRDRFLIITSISVGTALLGSMLSLMFAVIISPLPFPQGNQIAKVSSLQNGSAFSTSFLDYRDLSRSGGPFEKSIYVQSMIGGTEISGHPNSLYNVRFEGNIFSVFQKPPVVGDLRDLDSTRQQDTPTAVVSYSAWATIFGQDPNVLGQIIHIGPFIYQIRAVLAPEYGLILPADIWVVANHRNPGSRDSRDGRIFARLPTGVALSAANAYLQTVASSLQSQAPETNEGVTFTAELLKDSLAGQSKALLYLLALGAGLVLCVAYFNVYQLMVAKATTASSRWSLCLALGAGRRRLFLDLLREPLLLTLLGCIIGLFLSILGISVLRVISPTDIPRIGDTRLVWQVVLLSFLISILAAMLFASLMLARILSLETTASLHGMARAGASISHAFSARNQFLLLAQIALSTTLLICMGMLTAAFRRATSASLGFEADGVSITDITLKEPTNTPSGGEYARQLIERLFALPGVQQVAIASNVPFQTRSYNATFKTQAIGEDKGKEIQFTAVSPLFFQALQIRLLSGRPFLDSDDNNHPKVAILNHAAAQALFGQTDSLNKQLQAAIPPNPFAAQVVAVVEDVRQDPTTIVAPPIVYFPLEQTTMFSVSLILRANAAVPNAEIKSRIWSLNANQAVGVTRQLASLVDASLRRIRFTAFLMTFFATITMLLSALGTYAAVMQWLSTAEREIALRLAFGATHSQIRESVLGRVMLLAALALAAGAIAAFGAGSTLKSLLYGVQPSLGVVLGFAILITLGVAFLASYIPALRARFVDPMQLLRAQ